MLFLFVIIQNLSLLSTNYCPPCTSNTIPLTGSWLLSVDRHLKTSGLDSSCWIPARTLKLAMLVSTCKLSNNLVSLIPFQYHPTSVSQQFSIIYFKYTHFQCESISLSPTFSINPFQEHTLSVKFHVSFVPAQSLLHHICRTHNNDIKRSTDAYSQFVSICQLTLT